MHSSKSTKSILSATVKVFCTVLLLFEADKWQRGMWLFGKRWVSACGVSWAETLLCWLQFGVHSSAVVPRQWRRYGAASHPEAEERYGLWLSLEVGRRSWTPNGQACSLSRQMPQDMDKANQSCPFSDIPLEGREKICSFLCSFGWTDFKYVFRSVRSVWIPPYRGNGASVILRDSPPLIVSFCCNRLWT